MTPTIETWQLDANQIGPLYPWVGLEFWLFLAALLFCGYFMYWKIRTENKHYEYAESKLQSDSSPPHSEDNTHG